MSKNKKLAIVLAAVLIVIIGAFAAIWFISRPETKKGAKHITVDVINGETKTFEYDTDAEYLRGVLADENGLISGDDGEFGLYVKTVDGYTANESGQEWWCFTKGGETIMTGVDEIAIADGEHYEITLKVGYDF